MKLGKHPSVSFLKMAANTLIAAHVINFASSYQVPDMAYIENGLPKTVIEITCAARLLFTTVYYFD
jgi:hypothetical protein